MGQSIHEELVTKLNWRYATKKFNPNKKISEQDWKMLEESLILSPSSYGLQPFQFILVQNPDVRKKLTPVSYNQPQIETCSHLVVLTHLKSISEKYIADYIKHMAQTRGIPESNLSDYQKMMVGDLVHGPRSSTLPQWSSRQSYIAMGMFMTVAALLKVDVCPMEGLDAAQYDAILDLKNSNYTTVAAMAAGYRADDDAYQSLKKVRMDKTQLIRTI